MCHPGAGPGEFDRNNNRYDKFAADPVNGIVPGGSNGFDGDYFKANWVKSGVLEADCLICHLKDYHNQERKKQIKALNYKWAATVGGGFGNVKGAVIKGQAPETVYDLSMFEKDGKVLLPLLKEVPNENCLFCHHEADWKKRGQSYSMRTDVHMRAGLRCIDCHVTGRNAHDPRITGKEEHQIGKGDDPGEFVRNDLDNTMRTCRDCHLKGYLNAPVMKHKGLLPIHFKKIDCKTCHIPWQQVKAALVQDSSVFNKSPRINPPPKRIWSFYGPDIKAWNYYGDELGYPEGLQPFFASRPVTGWYKGKIYPLNRVYTLWAGIKTKGKKGIDQPHMKDIFVMWKKHMTNPGKFYPKLSLIKDDNKDGFPEVNRIEEIKALIESVSSMLKQKGMDLTDKKIVFVDGSRYTEDGAKWISIPKQSYEYSPYGSVHKISHDICTAQSALGAKGCKDCHSSSAPFFFKKIMVKPFDLNANPVKQTNAAFMGYSSASLGFMVFEHGLLKPVSLFLLLGTVVLLILHYILAGPKRYHTREDEKEIIRFNRWERLMHYFLLLLFLSLAVSGILSFSYNGISSDNLAKLEVFHNVCGILFILNLFIVVFIWSRDAVLDKFDLEWLKKFGGYLGYRGKLEAARFNAGQKLFLWFILFSGVFLAVTGLLMIFGQLGDMLFIVHCLHVTASFVLIISVMVHIYLGTLCNPGTLRGMFEGKVSSRWADEHHPLWKA